MSNQPFYVRFTQPEGLEDEAIEALQTISEEPRAIRRGTNETTKAIERGEAQLVLIALDVDPPEVVGHIPLLCEEKKIPYLYISTKRILGKSTGIGVTTASCAIVDSGPAAEQVRKLSARVKELAGI